VGVYENKKLIFVAKVKDGFVPRIRDEIFPALKKLKVVQTEAGLPSRIRRMDGRRTLEALHLHCHAR
jgi:uncharacterized protein YjhX (UPF0386 family)